MVVVGIIINVRVACHRPINMKCAEIRKMYLNSFSHHSICVSIHKFIVYIIFHRINDLKFKLNMRCYTMTINDPIIRNNSVQGPSMIFVTHASQTRIILCIVIIIIIMGWITKNAKVFAFSTCGEDFF